MGRSSERVRQGLKGWLKASRALKKEDQVRGQKLAEIAKKHSSEAFHAPDDPPEAAVFSVLVERMKTLSEDAKKDKIEKENEGQERVLVGIDPVWSKVISLSTICFN